MNIALSEFLGHDNYYEFLTWIASKTPPDSYIVECGTCEGRGAIALNAANRKVLTFDIQPIIGGPAVIKDLDIVSTQLDCFKIPDSVLLGTPLIYFDIDPHAGPPETAFYNKLVALGYRGVMVCDDIDMNPGMRAFWAQVDLPKYETGKRAHLTGVGLINFDTDAHTIVA